MSETGTSDNFHAWHSILEHRWFKRIRSLGVVWSAIAFLVSVAAAGLVSHSMGGAYHATKELIKGPPCTEVASSPASPRALADIVVIKSSKADETQAERARETLRSRNKNGDIWLRDTCKKLEPAQHSGSVANRAVALLNEFKATMLLEVESTTGDQTNFNLWRRRGGSAERIPLKYNLDNAGDQDQLVKEILHYVFLAIQETAARSSADVIVHPEARDADLALIATEAPGIAARLRRLRALPVSEETGCEIGLELAKLEFAQQDYRRAALRLESIETSNCSPKVKRNAAEYGGHTCSHRALHEPGKVEHTKCAESYTTWVAGVSDDMQTSLPYVIALNNRSFVLLVLWKQEKPPTRLQRAFDDNSKARARAAALSGHADTAAESIRR